VTTPSPPRATLLVVDDDPFVQTLVQHSLAPLNLQVETSDSAEHAAGEIRRLRPHIVVIDLTLPGSSGLELIRHVREAATRTRVLVLSGKLDPAAKVECLEAGADDYVTKPFDPDELRLRIDGLLRLIGR
jgi:DNA-binding response OmpR family regulator